MVEVSVTELRSLKTQQWYPSLALHLPKGEMLSPSCLLMHAPYGNTTENTEVPQPKIFPVGASVLHGKKDEESKNSGRGLAEGSIWFGME